MVKIRLMRVGKKKQPSYRVVVADSRSPRDGRIIETIGNYQPLLDPSGVTINTDRAVHWLKVGAQPSDQVRKLLQITGAWQVFKGEPLPTDAGAAATATPAAAAPKRKVKATPAASVDETPGEQEVEDLPEAVDQAGAAPESDTSDADAAAVPQAEISTDDNENKNVE